MLHSYFAQPPRASTDERERRSRQTQACRLRPAGAKEAPCQQYARIECAVMMTLIAIDKNMLYARLADYDADDFDALMIAFARRPIRRDSSRWPFISHAELRDDACAILLHTLRQQAGRRAYVIR